MKSKDVVVSGHNFIQKCSRSDPAPEVHFWVKDSFWNRSERIINAMANGKLLK